MNDTITFDYATTVYTGGRPTDITLRELSELFGGVTVVASQGLWVDDSGTLVDEDATTITVLTTTLPASGHAVSILAADAIGRGEESVAFVTIDTVLGGIVGRGDVPNVTETTTETECITCGVGFPDSDALDKHKTATFMVNAPH